jgi:hypothetical protein
MVRKINFSKGAEQRRPCVVVSSELKRRSMRNL